MRKFLISAAMSAVCIGFSGVPDMMAAFEPTLYGNLIYTRSWGNEDGTMAGIYRFKAGDTPDVTLEYHPGATNIYANGGAVYVDGKYYVLTHVPNTGKAQKNTLYTYDADSWKLLSEKEIPLTTSATDLTWCPVDGKVYGVFNNSTASGYVFGTIDLADGTVDEIKAIDLMSDNRPVSFLVVAADHNGDIYGITSQGDLYRFDRATGDYSLIGATGFVPALWNQSGCFDFTTKELYWAACNADMSALFKVDTATGKASKVSLFANDEEFVGLYSLSSVADIKGPQEVGALAVNLEGNSLSGTVSFTMPSVSISGDALSGTLDYVVEEKGETILSGSAAPGASVSRDVTFAEGAHTLVVYAVSSEGRGASSRVSVYAGNDVPLAPDGVTAVKNDGAVTISWNAVTSGANRGYIDPAGVTYTVTRMPDARVIASAIASTSCTDAVLPSLLGDYTYEVVASYAGKQGRAGVSAPLILGTAFAAPVEFDFTDEGRFKFFTVINANADDKTWEWSINGARCMYHRTNDTDDWLVSPGIDLKGGYRYTVGVVGRSSSHRYPEKFEVKAGTSPDAAALTLSVIEPTTLTTGSQEKFSAVFIPESDGIYHIGIHGISEKYNGGIYMYSLSVSEPVASGAPVASADLKAEAAPKGALEATVTAVAPAKAIDGSDLASLVKAEVVNVTTDKLVASVENPVPGEKMSVTDKAPVEGMNEYSVVFYSNAGKGYAATVSVYVGVDKPMPVTDISLRQVGDKALLAWKAPESGVNGGYVDPDGLTYRVAVSSTSATVADGLTGCSYTDSSQPVDGQRVLQYTVYATNAGGTSAAAKSPSLTFGTPYAAPFAESFAGGKEMLSPWVTLQEPGDGYPTWTPTTKGYDNVDYSQDGDLGWVKYSPKGTISLISPMVDITSLKAPILKFWMKSPDGPVGFDVKVSTDQGATWETVRSMQAECADWQCVVTDLAKYAGSERMQVAFRASTQEYDDMMLDNIRIADNKNVDLGIVSFTGPERIDGGTVGTYTVRILNEGSVAADGYTVNISAAGRVLGSARGSAIAPDSFMPVSIDVAIPVNAESLDLKASVAIADDEYAANDEATMSVVVNTPRLPVIGTLAAVDADGVVKLSWTRPDESRNPSAVTDDLESLTPWDFGGVNADNPSGTIGDYKVYDADRAVTVTIGSYSKHPNAYAPMAFQVAKVGKYPELDLSVYGVNARSGVNSFVAWGAAEGASSDWLILPRLFPGETTISFWAHAAAVSYGQIKPEKIEVLYSAKSNDISDFVAYGEAMEVPNGWKNDPESGFRRYEVTLPADARYAAIRASLFTQDNKAIVIDDISFVPATASMEPLEIKGYNIYRDGERIATSDVEEYADAAPGDGSHVYNVTTAYHLGESAFSNDALVSTSGIDAVVGDCDAAPVRYYNLQGVEVLNPVRGNIYIICYPDGTTAKHILR